ncbi:MAG: hypothetical protein EZS28_030934 [Streblomastix strix]|uniref:Uncharacterized protein n=1 Tax=Streblomastix strix TaxID=222440 RepID=A0A5J4UT25_9EUKA|nr:MAG: hypothetical protein EZS28_030934 [Streblomastix strix]
MTQQALHFYSFKELFFLYSPEIKCLPELKENFSKLVGEQKFVSDTNQPPLMAADKTFAVDPSSLSVSTRQNYPGPEKPRQPQQKPPNIFANTPHAAQMVSGKAMGEEEYANFELILIEQAPEDLWDMPVQGEQEEDPNGTFIIDTEKFNVESMQTILELSEDHSQIKKWKNLPISEDFGDVIKKGRTSENAIKIVNEAKEQKQRAASENVLISEYKQIFLIWTKCIRQ